MIVKCLNPLWILFGSYCIIAPDKGAYKNEKYYATDCFERANSQQHHK